MDSEFSIQARTPAAPGNLLIAEDRQPKASMGVKISAITIPIIAFAVQNWFVITVALWGAKIHPVQIAQMVGSVIGVLLFPMLFVLLFQIGKRFRTPRRRWSIFMWVSLLLLVSNVFAVFNKV